MRAVFRGCRHYGDTKVLVRLGHHGGAASGAGRAVIRLPEG